MSTRFWLTSAAPPFTPATRKGSWDVTGGEDIQLLGRKPQGSAGTSTINVGSTAVDQDVLLHRSISAAALNAKTMAGTATWTIGARESNVDLNGVLHIHIWVTVGNSDTVRGTLLSNFIDSTEFVTTATGITSGPQACASVAVAAGDRIVAEIGYRATSLVTTYNGTINYGNTGTTDLTAGNTNVTTQPGWIEFSDGDGIWDNPFINLTDTFTTIDAKWIASAGVAAVGGRARIDCTTATPNIYTAAGYQIQSSTLAVQVPVVPITGGGTTVNFGFYIMPGPTPTTTNLEILYSPVTGNLQFRNNVGGADGAPVNITYNAVNHAWWRFRESGGSIFMETSPDNSAWTTQRTISTMSQWMLFGGTITYFDAMRNAGTPDFTEIDNINVVTVVNRCKVWDGGAWVIKPVKYWDGGAWVTKTLKFWNGSAWV